MKSIIFSSLLLMLLSCGKTPVSTSGTAPITGKAYYKNKFAQDTVALTALAFQEIFVKDINTLNENYFEKVVTDRDGNFYIDVTKRPVVVFLKTAVTIAPNISAVFYDSVIVDAAGPVNIKLVAQFDQSTQNGFIVRITDSLFGPISGATAYLYNSPVLASLNNPATAINTFTADAYGKIFKTGLPQGTYYLNIGKTVDTTVFQRLLKTVVLNTIGLVEDSAILRKKPPTYPNGFRITVTDSLFGYIPGASVYLYNSQVLAASNDPAGAIDHFTTDINGKFSKLDMIPGTYFLNATKTVDTLTYQRLLKTILVPANSILTDTIIVRKRQ